MKNLIFKGYLITADFEEKTMTFEIENDMVVQAGNYTIVRTEDYEKLVNGAKQSESNCNIPLVSGSALLNEIIDAREEIIKTNGIRFVGIHENKVKQAFAKYGIKYITPF